MCYSQYRGLVPEELPTRTCNVPETDCVERYLISYTGGKEGGKRDMYSKREKAPKHIPFLLFSERRGERQWGGTELNQTGPCETKGWKG